MQAMRRMQAPAVVAAAMLALAACGGGGASGGGSAGPTTLAVQETAGVPSAFVAFGMEKGFFEKQGLQIKLQPSQGGATAVPSLVSGKIQVAGSNVVSLLIAASKGLPIQAVAPGTSAHGAGQKDFGALMVPKGSDVREVKDLAGRSVAVNTLNNIAEVVVRASLEKAGVNPERVELREVDFPEMGAALSKGDVDAAFLIEPFVTTARRDGDRIIDYSYVTTEPSLQVGAYAVSRKFAAQNPDAVKRYRAAVGETATYLMAHQSEFRTFLSERAKTPAKLAKSMELPTFTTSLNHRLDAEDGGARAQVRPGAGRRERRRPDRRRGVLTPPRPDPREEPPMKLDAFCHVMPRPVFDRLGAMTDTPAAANIRNRIEGILSIVDLDVRFRQMDEFGDDYRQIVSLPAPPPEDLGPADVSRDFARDANDELAALVDRHPDRFAGWVAAVAMNDPDAAVEEAERAVGLGALGAQIYTNVNGHPLDEERFEPFWATMAELDRMIWVHPSRSAAWPDYPTEERSRYEIWWVFGWPYETAAFMSRIVFSGVLERHPGLKILTHHAGSMIPFFAGRVGPGWDQLGARTPPDRREEIEGPELSRRPIDYFRMFYADTAVFGAAPALRCALDFFGIDRMLFASDSPFDPEKGPGYIRATIADIESLGLSESEREQLYEGNARRVIGV